MVEQTGAGAGEGTAWGLENYACLIFASFELYSNICGRLWLKCDEVATSRTELNDE